MAYLVSTNSARYCAKEVSFRNKSQYIDFVLVDDSTLSVSKSTVYFVEGGYIIGDSFECLKTDDSNELGLSTNVFGLLSGLVAVLFIATISMIFTKAFYD